MHEMNAALVVRTDFSDHPTWEAVRAAIQAPVGDYPFYANVEFVDERQYAGLDTERAIAVLEPLTPYHFVMLADSLTMTHHEHPLLVIDLFTERGRTFRALPSQIQSIENNLSIANMDFAEFANAVDADGVFRSFPEP